MDNAALYVTKNDEHEVTTKANVKSPRTSNVWRNIIQWHKPTTDEFSVINDYPIPGTYRKIFKRGLSKYRGMPSEEKVTLQKIKNLIAPGYPTKKNYRDFFHIALWLDETSAKVMSRRYNMENVTMKYLACDILELEVPGLAEKRPSLIKGHVVNIRRHGAQILYQGRIRAVNDTTIHIKGVHLKLKQCIADHPKLKLDVTFQFGRLPYERKHAAIDQCVSNRMLDCIFPDPQLANQNVDATYHIPDSEFINHNVLNNEQQKRAVINILNRTSGKAPYIVFGPPGTGKTVTIVEAILQIKNRIKGVKILVCAPSNAACDMLASKLIQHSVSTSELIRVLSNSRDWEAVPEDIKPYSNYAEEVCFKSTGSDLMTYSIVITTLILSGKYAENRKFLPDFVFIDEAAQAMEPEALIPVGLLTLGQQLVLAGDPKQLGPQCASAVAERLTLNVPLLERMMKMPLYKKHNPNFITMLKLNFRAHPVVLELPNKLFYDNQLQAVSTFAATDPIANVFIHHKIIPPRNKMNVKGQPVEFCAIFAKERREGRSPSYFNPSEVEMVVKYVKALINLTETKVSPADIGIVTPYIRQVYHIKEGLKQSGYVDIEVGTTEVFQGREKRIIIISTVRAQHLLHNRRYKLGFVKNEKRFNVALTRAMSKLIVIGCPHVLSSDKKCWSKYIEFCEARNAYFGTKADHHTDELKHDVINRMSRIHLRDSSNNNGSIPNGGNNIHNSSRYNNRRNPNNSNRKR